MVRKTQNVSVVPLQRIDPLEVVVENYPVEDRQFTTIFFHIGKVDSSGPSSGPAIIRIEGNSNAGFYHTLTSFSLEVTAPAAAVVTGTNPAGSEYILVSSVPASYQKGDILFIRNINSGDTSYVTGSEWGRIASPGSISITFDDPLTNDHNVGGGFTTTVYSGAELWPVNLNTTSISNIRILIDCSKCSKPIFVEAWATELNSY